ncbi:MAG: lysophospholipase, partial [Planctomycetes bacterium]|nr:lysophospholipase [Planctomycetota bacterium]
WAAEHRIAVEPRIGLHVREYRPLVEQPGRTLVLVHGLAQHGRRYEHIARFAVARGWNVIVPDHRGHGLSDGVPTHVRRFRQYVTDLNAVLDHFALPPETTAMWAHSMGGLVAIRHTQLFPERVAAAALMSPLLGVALPIPTSLVALGVVLSRVAPRARFRSRVDPADVTRNPHAIAERLNDTLSHRSVTAGWFFAMRAALRAAWREVQAVKVPMYVLQAGCDRLVDPAATERFVAATSSAVKHYECLPEHLHELLSEPDWSQTAARVCDWLDEQVPRGAPLARAMSA